MSGNNYIRTEPHIVKNTLCCDLLCARNSYDYNIKNKKVTKISQLSLRETFSNKLIFLNN